MAESNKSAIRLKLVIDLKEKRVLFAEASKDFVDFLSRVLSMPVAKLISLVGPQATVGSFSNVYGSLRTLGVAFKTNVHASMDPLLGIKDIHHIPTGPQSYLCRSCGDVFNIVRGGPMSACPRCRRSVKLISDFHVAPRNSSNNVANRKCGPADEKYDYMVMDDLDVKRIYVHHQFMCATSSSFVTTRKALDVAAREERVVTVGMNEAVKLMRAAMETENVLTSVFLK